MSNLESVSFEMTRHVYGHCLCFAAQRAARMLARRFDLALKPVGLTSGQFSLMMALNRDKPAPLGQIASLLAMDRTTLTANLKPLDRRGLLERTSDPEDRRGRWLALSGEGRRHLAVALPIWVATHQAIDAELAAVGAEGLRAGLAVLAQPPSGKLQPIPA